MPKQPKIRWRKGDTETLRREINRYNQRLYYQKKRHGDSVVLPYRENFTQAKASIETRADFNRYISALRGFNAKNYQAPVTDDAKLKQVVDNFNKRVTSLEKSTKNANWLPDKVDYQKLTEKFKDSGDYKAAIKRYSNFNAKTAKKTITEEGKETSEWYVQELEYVKEKVNMDRIDLTAHLGKQEVTFGVEHTGIRRAEMGKIKNNQVNPVTTDLRKAKPGTFDYFAQTYENAIYSFHYEDKKKLWHQNYIKGLIRNNYPSDVIELLQRIDTDKFAELIDLDEGATFDFLYDLADESAVMEKVREVWKPYDTGVKQIDVDIDKMADDVVFEKSLGYEGRVKKEHWFNMYMKVREHKK